MKQQIDRNNPALKDFAAKLSDEDLKFLHLRLEHRFRDDLPEALNVLSCSPQMDGFFSKAETSAQFAAQVDSVHAHVTQEYRRRHSR